MPTPGLFGYLYWPGDGIENNPVDESAIQYNYPWTSSGNVTNVGLGFLSSFRFIPYKKRRAWAKRVANRVYHILKGPDPDGNRNT